MKKSTTILAILGCLLLLTACDSYLSPTQLEETLSTDPVTTSLAK